MDNAEDIVEKSTSTAGESNKWIYLGIFVVVMIAFVILYFSSTKTQNQFVNGAFEFMGELIWQSV